ncbi:hypothetical protein Q1695_009008 [Nippostrongylus brasiliensis]|nr:hypothetical protein Q1695_009008 [Nippostrongylus brasiliensis]
MDAQLREKYDRLRRAIPPLPSPSQLVDKIVSTYLLLRMATRSMTDFDTGIRHASRCAEDHLQLRLAEPRYLQLLTKKLQLEFHFIRSQLRTFLALPPLLLATGTMSQHTWRAMMEQPHFDDEGEPLVMNRQLMERIIDDQIELLKVHRENLVQMREEMRHE